VGERPSRTWSRDAGGGGGSGSFRGSRAEEGGERPSGGGRAWGRDAGGSGGGGSFRGPRAEEGGERPSGGGRAWGRDAGGGGGSGSFRGPRMEGGVGTAAARSFSPRSSTDGAPSDSSTERTPGRFDRSERPERPPLRARPIKAPMLPSCYGCGACLQEEYDDVPGYVDAELLASKRMHRQLDTVLCSRCRLLAQGKFVPVVREASTDLAGNRAVITPQQLRDQLKGLADRAALIVKLVDMVDVSGSFLTRVRSLVGRNPVILVGTKADLLPRGTDPLLVKQWLTQLAEAHSLNVLEVQLVSSRTGLGVDGAVRAILGTRKGRDVYVLGAANVGKSLFIRAFLKALAARDPFAFGKLKYQPIASATPGTTLGIIPLDVFSGGSKLHDTPGVHLHHRVSSRLPPDDVKAVAVKGQLKGVAAPVSERVLAQLAAGVRGRRLEEEAGWSVLWGGFLRVDVLKAPVCARLVFFGPKGVALRGVETADAAAFVERELGGQLTPPSTREAALALGVMEEKRTLTFAVNLGEASVDVAVSGLGWFTVVGVQQSGLGGEMIIRLHAPRAVELFVRKPMPVRWEGFADGNRDYIALDDAFNDDEQLGEFDKDDDELEGDA